MSGDEIFTIQARRCKRCGRLPTSQEAVERGYGSAGGDRMRAAIMALGEMLEHMTRPSVIDLQVNEMNIANYINQGWLGKWKANNWENSHGAKIKHADLWKQVRFQEHAIRAKYERGLMIPGGQE